VYRVPLLADLRHFGIHREVWISANHPQPPSLGGKSWQPLWFELGTLFPSLHVDTRERSTQRRIICA
jgi:hypothetical protein